jgi:D-3-phosphoglycerate dehydrogenase
MNTLITARFSEKYLEPLEPYITTVRFAGYGATGHKLSVEKMKEEIKDVELLITEFENINEEVLSNANKLKIIVCCRNEPQASVDIEAATRRSIPVLFSNGRNAVSVAEYTFGLLIALARNIAHTDHLMKYTQELTTADYEDKKGVRTITSEWSLDPRAPFNLYGGPELYRKKMGVIGFGSIGREVGKRALAFGMKLLIADPYLNKEAIADFDAELVDLDTLMRESDFISVNCKVTPETTGLINAEKIAMMKPTAYLVNTARAAVMNYDDLYQALKEKKIAGAALDVYPKEPVEPDNPFLKLRNVVLSPHLAGSAYEIPEHQSEIVTNDLLRLLNGERPKAIANPEVLEKNE